MSELVAIPADAEMPDGLSPAWVQPNAKAGTSLNVTIRWLPEAGPADHPWWVRRGYDAWCESYWNRTAPVPYKRNASRYGR